MPRDYVHASDKNKRKKKKSKRRAIPKITIPIVLIVIILFLLTIVFIGKRAAIHATKEKNAEIVSEAKPVDLKKDKAMLVQTTQNDGAPQPINYEFYKMLPRMEVEIPKDQTTLPEEKQKQGYYLLQLASVKDNGAADAFQDKMIKAGYNPTVIKIARGDEEWFRVQLGPFKDEQSAQDVQESLQMKNIDSLMLFVKTNDK